MTKLLDEAVEAVKTLPAEDQDLAAELLMAFAHWDAAHYRLTSEQIAEVEQAKREVREGKFATEQEMADLWHRFGL
jgi:hypothetical protein